MLLLVFLSLADVLPKPDGVDDAVDFLFPGILALAVLSAALVGPAIATGWQIVTIPLGTVPAGTHTLVLGGYNNKKNSKSEVTTILIDDVTVSR